MRRWGWFLAVAWLATLAGCQQHGGPAGAAPQRKFRIAVIPKGTSHDFWNSVHAGVLKAAAELPDVEVTWKGPVSEGNDRDQIQIVEQFIANDYDGICLAPLNAVSLRKPVDTAMQHGVPVVIFDSGLADMRGVVSYVATNNYRGGQRAGEELARLLQGKGKYILVRYDVGSQSTEDRERGFLDALAHHPQIVPLSNDKHAGPNESGAISLAENLLVTHKEKVDGIFCPNQSTTSGVLTVLQRFGLAGQVKFIGFDAGENLVAALEKNQLHGIVLQDPVRMGYDAVHVMVEHLRGREVPNRVETEEALATPQNLDDPRIHSLLHPDAIR